MVFQLSRAVKMKWALSENEHITYAIMPSTIMEAVMGNYWSLTVIWQLYSIFAQLVTVWHQLLCVQDMILWLEPGLTLGGKAFHYNLAADNLQANERLYIIFTFFHTGLLNNGACHTESLTAPRLGEFLTFCLNLWRLAKPMKEIFTQDSTVMRCNSHLWEWTLWSSTSMFY